jgi:hypothetical protein
MCDSLFLVKAIKTIKQIRTIGKYSGDIVLMIGDDLRDRNIAIDSNTIIKYFPTIDRSIFVEKFKIRPITDNGVEIQKVFQWHKLHCFDTYFKQWNKCFYIDAGMNIYKDINPFFNLDCTNSFVAHSDAFPAFVWKLHGQFDRVQFPDIFFKLEQTYNMNVDYFQTTFMLYDSRIIKEESKNKMLYLSETYFNSLTNDQGIINLYIICERNIWKPLDPSLLYYDFHVRTGKSQSQYIMLKY